MAIYALVILRRVEKVSWRELWQGVGWSAAGKKFAALRFLLTIPPVIGLTLYLVPDRFLKFPFERPVFWLIVMVLYPVLSVLPQELMFRSFFFRRYRVLFTNDTMLILASALCFGFTHIVFHNWVSPLLSLIAGCVYRLQLPAHRSLKWAAIEHAAYGCMVFTIGIGSYFLVGGGMRFAH